jgi:HPt (histidine-containing phosphotransfer) domain-containing protein
MSDPSALDESALARLREWGGDKLLGQMIRLFLENAPTRMDQIRTGATGGDIQEAEKGAHSLKSSAANVGAMALRELAADIERAAGAGDVNRVEELFAPIEAAFAEAIAALGAVEQGLSG